MYVLFCWLSFLGTNPCLFKQDLLKSKTFVTTRFATPCINQLLTALPTTLFYSPTSKCFFTPMFQQLCTKTMFQQRCYNEPLFLQPCSNEPVFQKPNVHRPVCSNNPMFPQPHVPTNHSTNLWSNNPTYCPEKSLFRKTNFLKNWYSATPLFLQLHVPTPLYVPIAQTNLFFHTPMLQQPMCQQTFFQ